MNQKIKGFVFVAFLSILLMIPSVVSAVSYTSILSFGDSLTDNGTNGSDVYGYQHFTNGNVWVEYLADSSHLNVPLFDMAYGGATTYDTSPNLGWQVDTYLANVSSSVPIGTLVTVWAGSNDYPQGSASTAASNIASAIEKLANAGGRYFLVPNLPDAGLTPAYRSNPLHPLITAECQEFNTDLATDLLGLGSMYPNDKFYTLDTFTLLDAMIANPSSYGFTNVTSDGGENPPPGYLFWDSVHPTTQAHSILANYAMSAVGVPEPGALVLLATGVVGLLAYAWRRRGQAE